MLISLSGPIAVLTFEVVGQAGDETPLLLEAVVDEGRQAAASRPGKIRIRNKP